MSMYLSIASTVADMEDAYGTAEVETRLARIARPEPITTRVAVRLRRAASGLMKAAAVLDRHDDSVCGHALPAAC